MPFIHEDLYDSLLDHICLHVCRTEQKMFAGKVEENKIANGVLLIAVHRLHRGVIYVLNIVFYGKRELRPFLCRFAQNSQPFVGVLWRSPMKG